MANTNEMVYAKVLHVRNSEYAIHRIFMVFAVQNRVNIIEASIHLARLK